MIQMMKMLFRSLEKNCKINCKKKEIKPFYNLIILDDVNIESTNSVKNLVEGILTTEDPKIKFLVTTRNENFLKDYGKLYLKGFTQEESLDFLTQGIQKDEERKSQYQKLADRIGNLPLALYTARTYMENMLIGPKKFLELLKEENIKDIESHFEKMDSREKKLFTAMKFCIYQDLKENLKPEAFEMFQMTQFLGNEDIPICLLEFCYRKNGYSENSETTMISNFLVQELQRSSFGTVEGEDENRRLSVHSSILLTLSLFTSEKEKRELLEKLLWRFSLLFDKDVFIKKDSLRMKQLIPHANAFLRHAEKINLIADYGMLILMTFVYDVVGYGYSIEHIFTLSNEFSEKCKESCFQIIQLNEEEIDASLKKSCEGCDENSVKFHETLAKKKCDVLWKKLEEMTTLHSTVIHKVVPRFILQRFRTQSNMHDLSRHLNIEPSNFVINATTYETLVEKIWLYHLIVWRPIFFMN
ncbi:hypothetical protein KUTeg_016522 [Tegillarca granosa]|uniref:Uncharacterized protein n=1 Tax=Tegillarca granosa TaxID=220873 RepID=A0ABQ9EL41_TEGGR|nr:hypothetical protein KUTeg_016522 [Tegillarca granosa]